MHEGGQICSEKLMFLWVDLTLSSLVFFIPFPFPATIVCLLQVEPHILWNNLPIKQVYNVNKKQVLQILGLIENMSFFECPKCGERCDVFGHGGAQTTAQEMDMEFLGEVPLNIAIRETSDAGSPIVAASPSSEVAMVYKAIAVRLAAKLQDWTSSGAGAGPKITIR
jgi:nitrogenase subunit NifH